MLTTQDFLKLDYSPDLSAVGMQYICTQMSRLSIDTKHVADELHQHMSQKAGELAFRRHLDKQGIPYNLSESVSFVEQEYQAIMLGGRRCHVVASFVSDKKDIRNLRNRPASLLDEVITAPKLTNSIEDTSAHDLVVFILLGGLVAKGQDDLRQIRSKQLATNFMYVFPDSWRLPTKWKALKPLLIKSNLSEPCTISIGGEDRDRNQQRVVITLEPKVRTVVEGEFYSLSYLQSSAEIDGKIGLHSSLSGQALVVEAHHWKNIWIYGSDILILGYMLGAELHKKSIDVPAGMSILQARYGLPEKSKAISISDLQPIDDLLERTRAWGNRRK